MVKLLFSMKAIQTDKFKDFVIVDNTEIQFFIGHFTNKH